MKMKPVSRRWPGSKTLAVAVWLAGFVGLAAASAMAANFSAWVYPGASGRLLSQPDPLGNRILDFSSVGYAAGLAPLPGTNAVPNKVVVTPLAGDNTTNIQNAINLVSALPLDASGFRGAVLLSAGLYKCSNTLTIAASGVVLRGAGSYTNGTGTVLEATATNQYSLIQVIGSGSRAIVPTTRHVITNRYVPAGARSFFADSPSGLAVGDTVLVTRIATPNWIHDLGMDLLGPLPDVPWTTDGSDTAFYNTKMERVITHIEGNELFVDAPITCAIDAGYTNGIIAKYSWPGRISNVGVEHLYAKSDYFGSVTNETHAWSCVQMDKVVNGWVRDVNSQYFGYACVFLNSGNKYITVQDCQALDPVSIITGERRYAFCLNDAQYCLVKNCYTRQDRHQFVTQAMLAGPNVFVDGTSDNAQSYAGPHQRWATGILWDNITCNGASGAIENQNDGNAGTGHGWESANSVMWNNSSQGGYYIQSPPGANNWLIGSIGALNSSSWWQAGYSGLCCDLPHAPGNYDSSGPKATNVFPDSLYFAQQQDRLANPGLQTRDYWLGQIDGFTGLGPGGEAVTVEVNWSNAVQALAGGQPLDGFDVVTNSHWIPFSFGFTLAPNERVVGASLALALRANASATGNVLYLGATNNAFAFTNLGWLPVGTGTNTTVRGLDLVNQLGFFTNGLFNVAVQGDAGIDWAMLELKVAPAAAGATNILTPVADATVGGGTNVNVNFGTATNLVVQQSASTNNQRVAYLRWNLSGIVGNVFQARVVLTPLSLGAGGIEQAVNVANSNSWTEAAVTWKNQPGGGERFASWLPGTNGTIAFDVTPQALDALQGDKQLSLQLFSIGSNSVTYASRENANASARPQLVLLTSYGPVISAIGSQVILPNTSAGPLSFTVSEQNLNATNLTVTGSSSDPDLVPDANLVFGGSGTNRTVTVTPLANKTGTATMTVTVTDPAGFSASSAFTLVVSSHGATNVIWNGPGAGTNRWSNTNYWLPTLLPEATDDVKFYDAGASGVGVSNVNSSLDVNFGGNLASLQIANTNGNHTILVTNGQSLSLYGTNGLVVGTETDSGASQLINATLTGLAGSLNINHASANIIVRQGSAASGTHRATLDLSGLGNFSATVSQLLVGTAGLNWPAGTLKLARTNDLTLYGFPALDLSDGVSNIGVTSYLYLGLQNSLAADSIFIARTKGQGTLAFNPAFTNASPQLLLRGVNGDRVPVFNIGDFSGAGTSGSLTAGVADFSGGTVDALVDTLYVAYGQPGSGTGSTAGTLTLKSGTFDVNTMEVAYQNSAAAAGTITGTVNLSGSIVLVVNNALRLARYTGSGTVPVAILNLNGAAITGAGQLLAGGGNATITANRATFALSDVIGTLGNPFTKVTLTNSILQFMADVATTNLVATSLVTGGASNLVRIVSLPTVSSPTRLSVIAYSNSIGGAGYNFLLAAPLPSGFSGYLTNNAANSSVDLVFVSLPAVPPQFGVVSATGTKLVISGTNGVPGWPYVVLYSTNLTQPLTQWSRLATNIFDAGGGFLFTNTIQPNPGQRYFRLLVQ